MTLLKSPALVAEKLAKQWQNHQLREARWFADDAFRAKALGTWQCR